MSRMTAQHLLTSSAMRKQHLLVEFSGLKTACPQGVYMSLTPGDPTLWSGVILIRKGPYSRAILRFQISFPIVYPALPPLVTFSTDIFHPLLTPLTTQTYTTDIQDSGTVSATDEERLPPGGFSLRHGFPSWFGRASRSAVNSRQTSGQHATPPPSSTASTASPSATSGGATPDSQASISSTPMLDQAVMNRGEISTYEVLKYIRSTFDDEDILDSIPLEAAGNPGAWHAWRAHRIKTGKLAPSPARMDEKSSSQEDFGENEAGKTTIRFAAASKKPAEWNWEGVWELRVKRGIDACLANSALYNDALAGDDLIHFRNEDDASLETMRENMIRSMEQST